MRILKEAVISTTGVKKGPNPEFGRIFFEGGNPKLGRTKKNGTIGKLRDPGKLDSDLHKTEKEELPRDLKETTNPGHTS